MLICKRYLKLKEVLHRCVMYHRRLTINGTGINRITPFSISPLFLLPLRRLPAKQSGRLPLRLTQPLLRRQSHTLPLVLESLRWHQTGQSLIFFALPVSLPPIRILLANDMQNVAFLETDAELPARYVHVVLRVVIEVSSDVE